MTAKRFRFNSRTNCIEYDNKSILLDSYGEDIEEIFDLILLFFFKGVQRGVLIQQHRPCRLVHGEFRLVGLENGVGMDHFRQ